MTDLGAAAPEPSSSDRLCEDLLTELFMLSPQDRRPTLDRVCANHPKLAPTLRRRFDLVESQLDDDESSGASGGDADDERSEGSPPAPTARQTLGRFTLLERLGGGMADVYLVRDPERGAPVVLKLVHHPELQAEATCRSLTQEAAILARLDHPSIGKLLETGEIGGRPYLLRPYVEGQSLAEWIRSRSIGRSYLGREDLELVLDWLIDVARALAAAHAAGVVHRDVKPANILIPFQGCAQLHDFGLSQDAQLPGSADGSAQSGTLAYMAPELLESHGQPARPAADIYALGITLFECAALRLPFVADSRDHVVRQILHGRLPDVCASGRRLPRDLRRILAVATARQPGDRYRDATAFAEDLARLRRGERVVAPASTPVKHLRRWCRRHPLLAAATVAMSGAAATVAKLWWSASAALQEQSLLVALLEVPSRVRAAERRAEELVPGWPQQLPELRAWLHDDGEPLASLLAPLRLRQQALRDDTTADPALAATFRHALTVLEPFAGDANGAVALVRDRVRWAEAVAQKTIEDHRATWERVRKEVAADPKYHGLDLRPQLDLVPLGRDPVSGLQEFYHPRSGATGAPWVERTPQGLRRTDNCGLVFVLLPRSTFTMGHQSTDPAGPHYAEDASPLAPLHEVTLDAFFVSKYEMTQGQWFQATGQFPSGAMIGRRCLHGVVTAQHPVECVTAIECELVLGRLGLLLPTEAQWEYAAGGGAKTRFPWGDDIDASRLGRAANLRDRSWGPAPFLEADDGYRDTAPVGSFLPNPFGLLDCIGNVQEWCRDHLEAYDTARPRPGDGLRAPTGTQRIVRGGSFSSLAHFSHWNRRNEPDDRRQIDIGVRPIRRLDPEVRR